MTSRGLALGLGVLLFTGGCAPSPQAVSLRSLESSGDVSFLCLGRHGEPRNLSDCPDRNLVDGEDDRRPYALVTQKTRGEVALVDLVLAGVVDQEPEVPGFNFLPVGRFPTSIVSTPGSMASFVAVAEDRKYGIYALPTSCATTRDLAKHQPPRNLTSWPACSLGWAPGEMAMVVDRADRQSCAADAEPDGPSDAQEGRDCPADLYAESTGPIADPRTRGRRKLVVSLPRVTQVGEPTRGWLAVIDAQAVLDRTPGSFEPCPIDQWIQLDVDLPKTPVREILPADFVFDPPIPTGAAAPPDPEPAGFAQIEDARTGEHRLLVADQNAPVVHDLDLSDVCSPRENPPLLPASFADSAGFSSSLATNFVGRAVTTNKVAVSPLTTTGKRYLYAIDEFGNGGVMVFDVSPGATERTPLVRSNSERFPFESPDRIGFDAPAADVTFALRDFPQPDPATGAAQVGVQCDPLTTDLDSPGAKNRPAPDFSTGANARNLRGIFGFLALSSGQVAVVDVEDFDAPCRRPITTNPSPEEDFRGCKSTVNGDVDSTGKDLVYSDKSLPTVTNEVSCRAVETHRSRSSTLVYSDSTFGVRAPSLRSFPKLFDKDGRALSVDSTTAGRQHPRLLGVNFAPGDKQRAQVYVGSTLFSVDAIDSTLVIDPSKSDQNSLVLGFQEPRSYAPQEDFTARYEGPLRAEIPAATLSYKGGPYLALVDGGAGFCGSGVEDEPIARTRGASLGVNVEDLDAFATAHADYVLLKSEILDEADAYWQNAGKTCGGGGGFRECTALFGTHDLPGPYRELRIVKATVDTLTLESRSAPVGSAKSKTVNDRIACCFPEAVSYDLRASNEWVVAGRTFRHNITTAPDLSCVVDTNPLTKFLPSRVLELSCNPGSAGCLDAQGAKIIGNAVASGAGRDVACVVNDPRTDAQTVGQTPCIFTGLSGSFAIYRGTEPSVRDMAFSWEVRGGFLPLTVSLGTGTDPNSAPQSIVYSPEIGQLVTTDGATGGVTLLDIGTFATTPIY